MGRVQADLPQLLHADKDLPGRAVHDHPALVHHHHPVRHGGLVHVVGDKHHGDALVPVEGLYCVQHLPAARRVQHGRGLVQHDAGRLHGDDAGNGDALLLAAGEVVGRVEGELLHAHGLQGRRHPGLDFRRGHAQVLRAKGHVLLHHVGYDLVVRVLEHHAHPAADLQKRRLRQGVHAVYPDLSAPGEQHCVHMLGQGGLAGAVVAQNGCKAALPDGQVHPVQGGHGVLSLVGGIGKGQMFCSNNITHVSSS